MADSKFKRALNYSFQQEMDEIPPQYELERKYVFSHEFEEKMRKLIKDVNKKYVYAFGLVLPRYTVGVLLLIIAMAAVLAMRNRNMLDRPTARLLFSVAELIIVLIFGVSIKSAGTELTRTPQSAFSGSEEDNTAPELEFEIPVSPLSYSKSNEYRTTTLHTVEYRDAVGRVIYYERISINGGLLTKIDTPEHINSCRVHRWEAIWFEKDGQTNLVWADSFYRYTLKGMCNIDMLMEMAESLYK